MTTYVALLRGINVAGRRKLPMAELRARCEAAGLRDVRTYLQSGNVVCAADAAADEVASLVEGVVEEGFGFRVPVVVRTADAWAAYAASTPFPAAAEARPSLLHLCLAKGAVPAAAVAELMAKAAGGERVAVRGDALWVDYPSGAGRSKLTPAALDRAAGAPVTARNWRTVQALAALAFNRTP